MLYYLNIIAETLPEPVRMREAEAQEEAKLTEFQAEMVQMSAVLCGDYMNKSYPNKLVEGMTVAKAADYVHNAFKKFLDEGEKAIQSGAHESTILIPRPAERAPRKSKSFASKFFSCIVCDH